MKVTDRWEFQCWRLQVTCETMSTRAAKRARDEEVDREEAAQGWEQRAREAEAHLAALTAENRALREEASALLLSGVAAQAASQAASQEIEALTFSLSLARNSSIWERQWSELKSKRIEDMLAVLERAQQDAQRLSVSLDELQGVGMADL